MNHSEILALDLSFKQLLTYRSVSAPSFHRRYMWGCDRGKRPQGARDYFLQFLVNPDVGTFLGPIAVHSFTRRFSYLHGTDVSVFLDDGQHRLATVVLAATAILDELSAVACSNTVEMADRDEALRLSHSPLLRSAASFNMEFVTDDYGTRAPVGEFLRKCREELRQLDQKTIEVDDRYFRAGKALNGSNVDEAYIERARRENVAGRKCELSALRKQVQELERQPLLSSFNQIAETMQGYDSRHITRLGEIFLTRLERMTMLFQVLQPNPCGSMNQMELEAEAFDIFVYSQTFATPRPYSRDALLQRPRRA